MCVWVVYISTVCSITPPLTSSDSPQSDDAILSHKVYGELVILVSLWKNVSVKSFPSNADHPRHLMLLRKYVSRRAAGKGRAVLEGVGLDAPTIVACFTAHPLNEEGAVQEGLTKWCGGSSGFQPPTWRVLIEAMEYAVFAQYFVQNLIRDLVSFNIGMLIVSMCCLYCMHVLCLCIYVWCDGIGVRVRFYIAHIRALLALLYMCPCAMIHSMQCCDNCPCDQLVKLGCTSICLPSSQQPEKKTLMLAT